MFGWILHHVLLLAIIAVAAFAWLKGSWPERIGGLANLGATLCFALLQQIASGKVEELGLLALDGLLALTFMGLAVRYASLWIGAAMLLQAVQFSLHAYYYVTHRSVDRVFMVANNLVSWGIVLAILVGGLVSLWYAEAAKRKLKAASLVSPTPPLQG
jgi:hypothetical protein